MRKIAVVGQGFVGGALTRGMMHAFGVNVYDKNETLTSPGATRHSSLEHLVEKSEQDPKFTGIYFVCLPTPMKVNEGPEGGQADLSIVEDTLGQLSQFSGERIAVVKSTIPPGSTEKWNGIFEGTGLRVIFNPEFLTEANADDDFRTQNRIILGGPRPWINSVKSIYRTAYPGVPVIKTNSTTAEMVKYFTNVQLMTRVVLSCELWQVCQALNKNGLSIDYDKVQEYASYDQRLGGSHMSVPGIDGVPGARGHCFPKDINALIYLAREFDVNPSLMQAVWNKNLEVVPSEHRDWESMDGRAVSRG